MDTTTQPDPIRAALATVEKLDPEAISRRLDELTKEQAALRKMLRLARAAKKKEAENAS